jgi:dienelactone hydrolase
VAKVPASVIRTVRRTIARIPGLRMIPVIPKAARFVTMSYVMAQARRLPGPGGGKLDLPVARPTPGLAAQVALDEAVLAVMMSPKRMPHRADYYRMADEVPAARQLYAERGWLADPTAFHPAPPALARRDVKVAGGQALGLRLERLAFDSGYEPWPDEPGRDRWMAHDANRTAHAWVLRHADDEPRPWLICIHGFGTGTPVMDIPGFRARRLHRQLGLNLVFPTLPLHGRRRTGRVSGEGFMSYDLVDGVHAMAQAMWDLRRVLGWVRAQGAERVGVYGISLGGYAAALLATLDNDIHGVIAGIPPTDFPALFHHHAPRALHRRATRYDLVGPVASDVHRVISPLVNQPRVAFERRYVYAGLGDRMATPAQAYRLWDHWGRPRISWYAGNHVGYLWSAKVNRFVAESLTDAGLVSDQFAAKAVARSDSETPRRAMRMGLASSPLVK